MQIHRSEDPRYEQRVKRPRLTCARQQVAIKSRSPNDKCMPQGRATQDITRIKRSIVFRASMVTPHASLLQESYSLIKRAGNQGIVVIALK